MLYWSFKVSSSWGGIRASLGTLQFLFLPVFCILPSTPCLWVTGWLLAWLWIHMACDWLKFRQGFVLPSLGACTRCTLFREKERHFQKVNTEFLWFSMHSATPVGSYPLLSLWVGQYGAETSSVQFCIQIDICCDHTSPITNSMTLETVLNWT